jgi:hypothetical protein
VARERGTPASVVGVAEDVTDAIAAGQEHDLAAVNPWLWIQVQGAALRAQALLRQQRKAQLLRVSLRTYQRWVSATTTPSGDEERRLRVVARFVTQLRHSLTGPGVVEWFVRPRADLDGASPADALDDPDRLEPLVAAAAASRGNVAA